MNALTPGKAIKQSVAVICLLSLLLSCSPALAQTRRRGSTQRQRQTRPATTTVKTETNVGAEETPAPPPNQDVTVAAVQSYEKPTVEVQSPSFASIYRLEKTGEKIQVPITIQVNKPGRWQLTSLKLYNGLQELAGFNVEEGKEQYPFSPTLGEGVYEYRVEAIFKSIPAVAGTPSFTETANAPVLFLVRRPLPVSLYDNGITVGQTKLFDERSLSAKLQELETSLVAKGFVDPAALAKNTGTLQGARQDVSAFSLNVTGLPTPGIVDKATSSTGLKTTATGTETTSATGSDITTTTAAVTPAPPGLPGQTPAISPQLSFGQSPQDLLAEQVQLTYQIINLRTLLERSITDRVSANVGETRQRRAAVVGFQVSLDSRRQYQNAVAEVDVRISSLTPRSNPTRPNLISLIPKEKTYNVATITKNAKQFGFGAVVQVLNVGASVSRSKDTFYLVRDTDTVATERKFPVVYNEGVPEDGKADSKAITFGWQFRPVLGRKAVEPGTRNIFALLSLPPSEDETYIANVEVFTRWRQYDSKNGTVGKYIEGSQSTQVLDELIVPRDIDEVLKPVPQNVRWEDTNDGQALVIVNGKNFMPGTNILVGNTVLDRPQVGFVLSDERSLRFSVPLINLVSLDDLQMAGRFGSPFALRTDFKQTDDRDWGINQYGAVDLTSIDADNTKVSFKLSAKMCPNKGALPCLPDYVLGVKPLVLIGKRVFGAGDSPISITISNDKKLLILTFKAPSKLLAETGTLKVKYAFFDSSVYSVDIPFDVGSSFGLKNAVVLSSDDTTVQLGIRGSEFDKTKVTVRLGQNEYKDGSPEFLWLSKDLIRLNLTIKLKDLARVKNVIVSQDAKNLLLPIAVEPQPAAKPEVHSTDAIAMGDSKIVTLKGANFNSISEIRFEGRVLVFDVKDDGATLLLSVPSELTVLPGSKDLSGTLKDGKPFTYTLRVAGR